MTEMLAAVRQQLSGIADAGERRLAALEASDSLCRADPCAARVLLDELCTEAEACADHVMVSRACVRLAEICRQAGDLGSAESFAKRSIDSARQGSDRQREAAALNVAGLLHYERGEYARAHECYDLCLEISRSIGYVEGELAALNQRAVLMAIQGRSSDALDCHERCLAIDIERGSRRGEVISRINVGWVLEQFGRWEEAVEQFYRVIAISEQEGFDDWRQVAICNLGELFIKRRRLEQAMALFTSMIEEERRHDPPRALLAGALTRLGQTMAARGDIGAAAASYAQAAQILEALGERQETAVLCRLRAELALDSGQLAEAEAYLGRAAVLAAECGLRRELGETIRVRGQLFVEQGDRDAARDCFERALGEFAETPESYEAACVCLHFGRLLAVTGERVRARALLRQAAGAFHRLSVVGQSEEANRQLFLLDGQGQGARAVLAGLQGLERVRPEPSALVNEALQLLRAGLDCERVALLCGGEQLAAVGNGSPADVEPEAPGQYELPIGEEERHLVLRFTGLPPQALEGQEEVLTAVGRLLADPAGRLIDARGDGHDRPGLDGLAYTGIVGSNRVMLQNLEVVVQVADTMVPVLIQGESGTGKELVARALHESSRRRTGPFCAVNCAAVPEGLLEAEFFGVARGAATGVVARKGKFELAAGGTVFLDEIGDMSPGLQAKLLRVLQEGEFESVGSTRTVKADVRIVAATNQELSSLIRDGRFRTDLFYRLNAVEIVLPPLRDRREDIPELVRHFIRVSSREFGRHVADISEEALAALLVQEWPGNIRELQHVVERAVILCRHTLVSLDDLPAGIRSSVAGNRGAAGPVRDARREARRRAEAEVERTMLLDCLNQCGWNAKAAAEKAGFSRAQFYRLLRRHNIERPS